MGCGEALEERPKEHVAMPGASPAAVCYKSLPQVTALVLSGSPGAWNFPVPASFNLGVGEVSEQTKGSL